MKVDIVEFVENEMVELDVAQIGLNWGWIEVEGGDESDCGSGERGDKRGDGYAKIKNLAGIPFNTKLPSLHPLPDQSEPIVPTPSYSLS